MSLASAALLLADEIEKNAKARLEGLTSDNHQWNTWNKGFVADLKRFAGELRRLVEASGQLDAALKSLEAYKPGWWPPNPPIGPGYPTPYQRKDTPLSTIPKDAFKKASGANSTCEQSKPISPIPSLLDPDANYNPMTITDVINDSRSS